MIDKRDPDDPAVIDKMLDEGLVSEATPDEARAGTHYNGRPRLLHREFDQEIPDM